MINLYIRDYVKWTKEKKTDIVRKWILELRERPEFQKLNFRVRMIADFIRTQEKNFRKAFALAQELNLPPPIVRTGRSAVQLHFVDSKSTSKTPKEQVEHACHYFDRLYHTLAPKFYSVDSTPQRPPSPYFADDHSTSLPPTPRVFERSPSASPLPSDDTCFSIPSDSSRSTPEIPNDLIRKFPCSFTTIPIHKPTCTAEDRRPPLSSFGMESSEPLFTFLIPRHGDAPIPTPIPKYSTASESSEAITGALSDAFETMAFGTIDRYGSRVNGLVTQVHSREISLELPAAASRKRKRSVYDVYPRSQLQQLRNDALADSQKTKLAHRIARMKELELAITHAKETSHVQLAPLNATQRRMIYKDSENNRLGHEESIGGHRMQLSRIERERGDWHMQMEQSLPFPDVFKQLNSIRTWIVYDFRPNDCEWKCVSEIEKLERKMRDLSDQCCTNTVLESSGLSRLHATTKRILKLCHIRLKLLRGEEVRAKNRRSCRDSENNILRQWFIAHSANPFPTKEEKLQLSRQSGVSMKAVTRWFTNARSRGTSSLSP